MPTPNYHLKHERQLKGWSQAYLGEQIDVPGYYISRWERGEVTPSPYYQQQLCHLFGRTAEELGFLQPADPGPFATTSDPMPDIPFLPNSEEHAHGPNNDHVFPDSGPLSPDDAKLRQKPPQTRQRPLVRLSLIASLALLVGIIIGTVVLPSMWHPSSPAHAQHLTMYSAATSGTPTLSDALQTLDENQWDTAANECTFQDGGYYLFNTQSNSFVICKEEARTFCNFAIQVDMTIISGDGAGLILRAADNSLIRFRISPDGSYNLVDADPTVGFQGTSKAIKGLGKLNVLTSIVQGETIDIYANGEHLGTLQHSKSPSCGQVGFLALKFSQSAEVHVANLKIWKF